MRQIDQTDDGQLDKWQTDEIDDGQMVFEIAR